MKNLIKLQLLLLALLLPATAVAYDYGTTYTSEIVCTEGFEAPSSIEKDVRLNSSTHEFITAPAKEDPQPEVTPTPEFVITETEDAIIIDVIGEGEIQVYVNGEEVELPCTIDKGEEAQEIVVTASAQGEGMEISETAEQTVVVPAAGEMINEAYIVLINYNGEEVWYPMTYAEDYDNWYIMKDLSYPFPEDVPFYFVVNGVRYGAETDMTLPEMGDADHTILNPLYETENYFCVPATYNYTWCLYFFDGELFMTVAQGKHLNYYEYDEIAYDFCVDGLYYSIIDDAHMNEIRVTYEKDHYYVEHYYNYYYSSHSSISNYTGDLIVPETVFYDGVTYSVTEIGDDAFIFCNQLTSITIPNSVTSIGSSAFYGCSGLASVNIPNAVTLIGRNAFYNCSGLTSISVDSNNITYDSRDYCNAIIETASNTLILGCKNTVIPNTVNTIGENAFGNCSGLTIVNIPNSVTVIDDKAFGGCRGLTEVAFGNSINYIGKQAFAGCDGLTSVTIPNSVTYIDDIAFGGCRGLTEVAFGNSINYIGKRAFAGCDGLTSVTIPNSVTHIGSNAFSGCSSLDTLNFNALYCDDFGHYYDDFEYDYTDPPFYDLNISILNIGNGVKKIPAYFAENLTILTGVTIPNSVTSIGDYAFSYCSGLNDVHSYIVDPLLIVMGDDVFSLFDNYDQRTLHVPSGSLAAYQANNKWSQYFGNIVEMDPVPATSIGLNKNEAEVLEGETLQLTASITPSNAIKTVNWTSSDPLIATVDENGLVTALAIGSATITAMTIDGSELSASCVVTVQPNIVLATSIGLNQTAAEVTEGETLQLNATVQPDNATDKSVNWSSSNPAVAAVDENGLVTAVAPGTATITATTVDGSNLSASCLVTVIENQVNYDNYLSMGDTTVMHGETIVIPVKMTNEASIISFQTDIFLPEGLELLQEDGEYIIDPSSRMTRTHSIMSNAVSNGAVRVVCYSSNYKPFTGNSGDDLFYLTVKVADDAEGDYTIQLQNTLFTTSDFDELSAPTATANVNVKAYLLGDANNSGAVTVTDVVVTSQYILEMDPNPFIFEAADVNVDGNITVTDVSRIAWMVLNPSLNAPQLLRAPALWNNDDLMRADGITLAAGETRRVSILLDNDMDYAAFQLDLELPSGLTAGNFQLTDRASGHAFDVNVLRGGKIRALCYTPALTAISGHEGALLTFDVTATGTVKGDISVDGIELVTPTCQTVNLDGFAIGVNNSSAVNELSTGKAIARVDYFNLAGQQVDRPESGVTLVVTTYTDGTRTTTKVIQ